MSSKSSSQTIGGVRVRPNIIAVRLEGQRLPDKDLVGRLTYWELLELSRALPLRFPPTWVREEALTERQRAQKDGFIRPAQEHALHLWKDIPGTFRPMPITQSQIEPPPISFEKAGAAPSPSSHLSSPQATEQRSLDISPDISPLLPSIHDHNGTKKSLPQMTASDVVEAPLSSRVLVTAPPGTGKTHLMLDRLVYLIQSGEIHEPHNEVLVLSFTRATVSEIYRKLANRVLNGAPSSVQYVEVRTFDSLATALLLLENNVEDYFVAGYDERIKRIRDGLMNNRLVEAQDRLRQVRYLVIDEVQDLTGIRALFVFALMRCLHPDAGILLLGDPAQAIYDFDDDKWKAVVVLQELRNLLGPKLQTVFLNKYYRFRNPQLENLAMNLRDAVKEDGETSKFITTLMQTLPTQSLDDLAREARHSRIAVLTRNNLEVFQLYQWARLQAFDTDLRVRQAYWPAWIGRLLFGVRGEYLGVAQLRALWKQRIGDLDVGTYEEAEELWETAGLLERNKLDLNAFSDYLRTYAPVAKSDTPGLIITTIHQSKGLEYDTVAVLEPTRHRNLGGQIEELRVLYVAATRAREKLVIQQRSKNLLKFGSGIKDRFSHFHRYVDHDNWFLITTKEDISWDRFWHCPSNISLNDWKEKHQQYHEEWWRSFQVGGTWSLPWTLDSVMSNLGMETIIGPSGGLSGDLRRLHRFYNIPQKGILEAPVSGLVTVVGPPDADSSVFGTAQVTVIPWVFGWARVVTGRDVQ